MRDAFASQLLKLAKEDPDVIFITGDLGFGVFTEYMETLPEQYLNIGVAEQNMTGVATGLALEGKRVFTYSIANFATLRCLEQIRNDAAYHNVNLTVVSIGGGFNYGQLGMSHHATEDLAIMRALPNVTSVAPGSAWEAKCATEQLNKLQGVGYLRLEKGGYSEPYYDGCQFEIGKAITIKDGTDITLISTGGILSESILAYEKLKLSGIHCKVVSMHTIKPIDHEVIISSALQTGGIVTIEEHSVIGGLGGSVAEVLVNANIDGIGFGQIAMNDQYSTVVGDQSYLRQYYGLNADSIVKKVQDVLAVNRKKVAR